MTSYRLGIDVGGTNTDAVVLTEKGDPVLKTKTTTTADITGGILTAFDDVLSKGDIRTEHLEQVMLGTTHCTNAIAERSGLNTVGVLRLGEPATQCLSPYADWPDDLVGAIGENFQILPGGYEYTGEELTALDPEAVRAAVRDFDSVDAFAVIGVFSPVRTHQEDRVKDIIREEIGDKIPVSLSHEIGNLGFIERENATILNAALTGVAEDIADSFYSAMQQRDVDATLYFARNDGTLMNIFQATRHPIFMMFSGPANSIRGAAHLSGVQDGIVIDAGGTTTDLGVIQNGFPRRSTAAAEIGGVKANFPLPDIVSLPIGGGSLINTEDGVEVGPESVGSEVTRKSLVFGGDCLTMTDIGVQSGDIELGQQSPGVDEALLHQVEEYVREHLTAAVSRLRTNSDPVPAVVVGGGSFLVPEQIEGLSSIECPEYYDTANAVGVATAQVSGRSDNIYNLGEQAREKALKDAKLRAVENAVEAGADRDTVMTLSIEEIPLTYLADDMVRIKVDVAGNLTKHSRITEGVT